MNRKLKMGMVGGGRGAFIGTVHRIAAAIDNQIELVCGALSSTPEKSIASGKDWRLPRVYGSYAEMFQAEARLPLGERMDFVAIVTPNHMHFPVAMAALDAGFSVVCDKPMTLTLDQAKTLAKRVKETGLLFALTHNYTGYPMVKEARELVRGGALGKVRRVVVEYPQGWLASQLEGTGQKQASWRTDPKRAGASCCMGDIGSHCENLAEYITGLRITSMSADLATFVKGRKLDDDGSVLLRFHNGARGILWASQIAVGRENDLNIRVFGEKGALEWHQQEPNTLIVDWTDKPRELRRTSTGFVGKAAAAVTRIPAGHPEGYLEAFATIYRNFAAALADRLDGRKVKETDYDYPTVQDGVRGMAFLQAVVKSNRAAARWTKLTI
jgi:predicted dehydrogenase